MESESNKASIVARWGPRCEFILMISVGLAMAYLGIHAATTGGGGWFAKLVAGALFFVLGALGTLNSVGLIFRLISLGMYLRIYGFTSKGLNATSPNDETNSSRGSPQ
jgi:hypothetical protein